MEHGKPFHVELWSLRTTLIEKWRNPRENLKNGGLDIEQDKENVQEGIKDLFNSSKSPEKMCTQDKR